jgi:hypothetical protein
VCFGDRRGGCGDFCCGRKCDVIDIAVAGSAMVSMSLRQEVRSVLTTELQEERLCCWFSVDLKYGGVDTLVTGSVIVLFFGARKRDGADFSMTGSVIVLRLLWQEGCLVWISKRYCFDASVDIEALLFDITSTGSVIVGFLRVQGVRCVDVFVVGSAIVLLSL